MYVFPVTGYFGTQFTVPLGFHRCKRETFCTKRALLGGNEESVEDMFLTS